MSDQKISELTNLKGPSLSESDELVIVDTSAVETKALTVLDLKEGLGLGPVGPMGGLIQSASEYDAQSYLGVNPRRFYYATAGRAYPVFARDSFPTYHYALPLSDQDVSLDLSGLSQNKTYLFVNGGRVRSTITLDCGPENYFVAPHITPTDTSFTEVTLSGSESGLVVRASSRPFVFIPLSRGEVWESAGGGSYYKRQGDGTYKIQYRRTSSISASLASTVTVSGWGFNSAVVESICPQPNGSGTIPPASWPIITELGSATGLTASQFKIYNPNASTWTVPVTVTFSGVERL